MNAPLAPNLIAWLILVVICGSLLFVVLSLSRLAGRISRQEEAGSLPAPGTLCDPDLPKLGIPQQSVGVGLSARPIIIPEDETYDIPQRDALLPLANARHAGGDQPAGNSHRPPAAAKPGNGSANGGAVPPPIARRAPKRGGPRGRHDTRSS